MTPTLQSSCCRRDLRDGDWCWYQGAGPRPPQLGVEALHHRQRQEEPQDAAHAQDQGPAGAQPQEGVHHREVVYTDPREKVLETVNGDQFFYSLVLCYFIIFTNINAIKKVENIFSVHIVQCFC